MPTSVQNNLDQSYATAINSRFFGYGVHLFSILISFVAVVSVVKLAFYVCRCLIQYVMQDFRPWLQHVKISESSGCSPSMLWRIARALFLTWVSLRFPRVVGNCNQFYIFASG